MKNGLAKFKKFCSGKERNELKSMMSDALEDGCPPDSDLNDYKITVDEWFSVVEGYLN